LPLSHELHLPPEPNGNQRRDDEHRPQRKTIPAAAGRGGHGHHPVIVDQRA
jgi:hypothetical protein